MAELSIFTAGIHVE